MPTDAQACCPGGPTGPDKMYHGPVAVPAPYFDPAFAHAKPATGAGDIPVAAGAPTAAVTDDDGSHASNGFCIAQGMDALIESFEASAATTLSDPASPNYDATPAARESPTVPSMTALPSLSQHQQQHRWGRLMPSPPTSRKAISSHIAGTGTFMVMYQRGPAGDMWTDFGYSYGTDPTYHVIDANQRRPGYLGLRPAEQELMLQEGYQAVLGVCNAMVPGNGLELMDALMETTEVYRKRYGYKKNIFDLDGDARAPAPTGPNGEGGDAGPSGPNEEELVRITPTFQSLGGSSWLNKDRYFRKRRACFTQLARSQRARVIKSTYELLQAVGEEFSPGTRLDLLDRVFEHHTNLRPIRKRAPSVGAASSSSSVDSHVHWAAPGTPSTKRARGAMTTAGPTNTTAAPPFIPTAPPAPPAPPALHANALFTAAATILAHHWAQALSEGGSGGGGAGAGPLPSLPPFPCMPLPPPPPAEEIAALAHSYAAVQLLQQQQHQHRHQQASPPAVPPFPAAGGPPPLCPPPPMLTALDANVPAGGSVGLPVEAGWGALVEVAAREGVGPK